MTINKSQGQTLKIAGLDLTLPCFSHGQLYVGCSRVGSPQNLFILAPNGKTRNIVYPEALYDRIYWVFNIVLGKILLLPDSPSHNSCIDMVSRMCES